VNKSELILALSSFSNINARDSEKVVDLFFDTIIKGLRNGERAELRGFGSFTIRNYPSYVGRNPKSGNAIVVGPKRMPIFKPGKELKAMVDAPNDGVQQNSNALADDDDDFDDDKE
jgi:integration host factor subunit beta